MLSTLLALALAAPLFQGELIFPPQEKHTHGSSIVQTPEGDLLTVWFYGSGERKEDDVQLLGARKAKGSDTWSAPFPMADTPNLPDCNPVLFIDPSNKLWLFWVVIQDNEWGGALLTYRTSTDYAGPGAPVWNWQEVIHSRPTDLEPQFLAVLENAETTLGPLLNSIEGLREGVEDGRVAAKSKLRQRIGWMTRIQPIVLQDGRILLGLYSDVFNCSLAAFSDDGGKTWGFSEPILDPSALELGNVQPSFVQRENGDVVAFMRDNGFANYVRTAVSTDRGATWSAIGQLAIRDTGASVQALRLASGKWILINNDQIVGRHRISVHVSDDEGQTWKWARPLELAEKDQGSFSYPSAFQAPDGTIHATYSYTRQGEGDGGESIKHVAFNEDWLLETPLEKPLGGTLGE